MAALAAWLFISWVYAMYVNNFANYSVLYGSIGTVIVLLIWLNLTAVTLIMGAELNGTLISLRKDGGGASLSLFPCGGATKNFWHLFRTWKNFYSVHTLYPV
ncbi:MAG: YhjD/YihY/BrkB family envelope integrity protein [Oscillospiraceae bacterium]